MSVEALFGFIERSSITVDLRVDHDQIPLRRDKEEWEIDSAAEWEVDNVIPVILPTLHRLVNAKVKVKIGLERDDCKLSVADGNVTLEHIKEFRRVRNLCNSTIVRYQHYPGSRVGTLVSLA
jgi:hypothetical protein